MLTMQGTSEDTVRQPMSQDRSGLMISVGVLDVCHAEGSPVMCGAAPGQPVVPRHLRPLRLQLLAQVQDTQREVVGQARDYETVVV